MKKVYCVFYYMNGVGEMIINAYSTEEKAQQAVSNSPLLKELYCIREVDFEE